MSPTDRSWSDLADVALFTVLCHLSSFIDRISFAGVCHSWRSVFKSTAAAGYAATGPPLFLHPTSSCRTVFRCDAHCFESPREGRQSLLSVEALSDLFLGCSYGRLILLRSHRRPLLADALTGSETHLPVLPTQPTPYYYASLTAPPSDASARLLVFYSEHAFLSCRLPGVGEWKTHALPRDYQSLVARVILFKGQLYALSSSLKLLAIDFSPELKLTQFDPQGLPPMPTRGFKMLNLGPQLVECGGEELVLLLILPREGKWVIGIETFKMDFGRMVWVATERVGGYALFVDCAVMQPFACADPKSWGGVADHVFFLKPLEDTWHMVPINVNLGIEGYLDSMILPPDPFEPCWPSSLWFYPSMCY